jgi:hypothetical protein
MMNGFRGFSHVGWVGTKWKPTVPLKNGGFRSRSTHPTSLTFFHSPFEAKVFLKKNFSL